MRALWSAVSAALGLIALQAVVSRGGSGRIAEAFALLQGGIDRALDPSVPAITDRRTATATTAVATTTTRITTNPSLPVSVSA